MAEYIAYVDDINLEGASPSVREDQASIETTLALTKNGGCGFHTVVNTVHGGRFPALFYYAGHIPEMPKMNKLYTSEDVKEVRNIIAEQVENLIKDIKSGQFVVEGDYSPAIGDQPTVVEIILFITAGNTVNFRIAAHLENGTGAPIEVHNIRDFERKFYDRMGEYPHHPFSVSGGYDEDDLSELVEFVWRLAEELPVLVL